MQYEMLLGHGKKKMEAKGEKDLKEMLKEANLLIEKFR